MYLTNPGYVRGSEADALAISKNIQARHFPYSTVIDPVFESPTSDRIVSYTRCGDSALWTGMYLAAEAFRYKVTRSPDALDNARRAVTGIQYLTDITGNNVLARCLVPDDSPYAAAIQSEEAPNGIYHSAPGTFWVGHTSRDQYSGVVFGLAVAYEMIDDQAMRSTISRVMSLLVQFLKDHGWSVVLPDGTVSSTLLNRPDQQLAFLQAARYVNPDQFSTAYDVNRVLLSVSVPAPISFDVLSDDSYFKFNLDNINLHTLIHLESSSFGDIYRKAYDILRNHTDDQLNAFFNMIDYAINGPNPGRDADTRRMLDEWLQRPRRDVFVDNSGKYPACGDQACNPIAIRDRVTTDFIWQRSPYQLTGGGSGTIETAGIDYILPYWMARFYKVIGEDDLRVVSSTGGAVLTPAGLASIFGSNLAGATQSSSTQPPPESLGGVSVTVSDSTGVARPAQLYYVSPGQINLVVPPDTALGTASFTVRSAENPDMTTSGEVRAVAPGLISADGSGTGAAAATGVRLTAGGQQFPVTVFTCQGATCTTVPIDPGLDTPVYLTFYGTGIRNRSNLQNVVCTIGGVSVAVLYADAQPQYSGLDQVNVPLTLNLRGKGLVNVSVTVDGKQSNPVQIYIQ